MQLKGHGIREHITPALKKSQNIPKKILKIANYRQKTLYRSRLCRYNESNDTPLFQPSGPVVGGTEFLSVEVERVGA